jgi:NADPH:quinone reductase-like Zn-dependent oxidoreductase
MPTLPSHFDGIGYSKEKNSWPLESIRVPVPQPSADQVLIHAYSSSLNPLEYKLALLNFFDRTPPVILGFDLAGVVAAKGANVKTVSVGDEVMALTDSNKDGGWATGGHGGYALASDYLTVQKSSSLSFDEAGVLPICFLSAYIGISPYLNPGETIYIPGGAGGVSHLAIQLAAHALGAGSVISSGSKPDTIALAKKFGAQQVFNYRTDATVERVNEFTDGKGADLVFDATYSEAGFVESAKAVRPGGKWVVLGVGPGKTSRGAPTKSPVESILAGKGAQHINANLLRYFTDAELKTPESNGFLANGMQLAIQLADENKVKPYISKTIQGTVEDINRELNEMREGRGVSGKVAVQLAYGR